MSVLKMIVADDRQYVAGELHGSCAQWVYAACSRNPKTLDELDKLLPEFGADSSLRELFLNTESLALEPIDAGLIIVDLAKKWIFAEDSYFGAYRRGRYEPKDDEQAITYEFSQDWQFVAAAKWFRYLQANNLKRWGRAESDSFEPADDVDDFDDEASWSDFAFETLEKHEHSRRHPYNIEQDEDDEWDEELARIDTKFTNRSCSLIELKPENPAEERDLRTLELILKYDEKAAKAKCRIEKAQGEIASLTIELQAAESLWKRKAVPDLGLKRIALQAHLDRHDEHISHWTEEQSEAEAMATELRTFVVTDRFRARLKVWDEGLDESTADSQDDFPY